MRESMYQGRGKTYWSVWAVVIVLAVWITLFAPNGFVAAGQRADAERPGYSDRELQLLSPGGEWGGLTVGLGPEPAKGFAIAQSGGYGVKVRVLAHDAATDELKVSIETERTRPSGVAVSFETKLKPWEPTTFSNGACAGYVFWIRERNVKPEGYASLNIRGFCP